MLPLHCYQTVKQVFIWQDVGPFQEYLFESGNRVIRKRECKAILIPAQINSRQTIQVGRTNRRCSIDFVDQKRFKKLADIIEIMTFIPFIAHLIGNNLVDDLVWACSYDKRGFELRDKSRTKAGVHRYLSQHL